MAITQTNGLLNRLKNGMFIAILVVSIVFSTEEIEDTLLSDTASEESPASESENESEQAHFDLEDIEDYLNEPAPDRGVLQVGDIREESPARDFDLEVRGIDGKKITVRDVSGDTTIEEIQAQVHNAIGQPLDKLIIILKDETRLLAGQTLGELNIQADSLLNFVTIRPDPIMQRMIDGRKFRSCDKIIVSSHFDLFKDSGRYKAFILPTDNDGHNDRFMTFRNSNFIALELKHETSEAQLSKEFYIYIDTQSHEDSPWNQVFEWKGSPDFSEANIFKVANAIDLKHRDSDSPIFQVRLSIYSYPR